MEKITRHVRFNLLISDEWIEKRNKQKAEYDKANEKAKPDLFRIITRHPDTFPVSNFTYLRKKLLKKHDLLEHKVAEKLTADERDVLSKKVREWIQRTMDSYEEKILEQEADAAEARKRDAEVEYSL